MPTYDGGDVRYEIRVDGAQAKQEIANMEGGLKRLGASFSQTSRTIGIGMTAIGAAITGIAASAVSAAGEQERAEAQLAAVLTSTKNAAGLTADELKRMAAEMQAASTFGDETIIMSQSLLLTFTKIGQDVFPRAQQTILDMATAMGTDLQGATIQLGKALNDPIKGVAALNRVGVQFTDQQKAQIETMVEAGDIMKAQTVILDELAIQFGGRAAAEAATFSGQLQQMKNEAGDVMEQLGFALMPVLKDLIDTIRPMVKSMAEWIQKNPELTASIVKVTAAMGALFLAVGPLLIALPGIIGLFQIVGIGGGLAAGVAGGGGTMAVSGALMGPFGLIALLGLTAGALAKMTADTKKTIKENHLLEQEQAKIAKTEVDRAKRVGQVASALRMMGVDTSELQTASKDLGTQEKTVTRIAQEHGFQIDLTAEALEREKQGIQNVNSIMPGMTQNVDSAAASYWNLANAIQAANNGMGGTPGGYASGGAPAAATGGLAMGGHAMSAMGGGGTSSPAGGPTTNMGGFTVNVNGIQYQTPRQLAKAIAQEFQGMMDQSKRGLGIAGAV